MEFLPLPPQAGARHPDIPFVATLKLEKIHSFEEFPQACGFFLRDASKLHQSEAEIADFVQSWLYFGLLSEITGEDIDPYDFKVTTDNGSSIVRLFHLSHRLHDIAKKNSPWKFRKGYSSRRNGNQLSLNFDQQTTNDTASVEQSLQQSSELVPAKRRQTASSMLTCVRLAWTSISQIERCLPDSPNTSLELVILSVRALLQWLDPTAESPIPKECLVTSPAARALRRIMLINGWCISHWDKICRSHNYEVALYLSALNRRTGTHVDHSLCTNALCCASRTFGKVSPSHVSSGCECHSSRCYGKDAAAVILTGRIPLVSIEIDENNEIAVSIKAWNGIAPFTAISHVWADGLGNSEMNALPECQLRRLHRLVKGISPKLRSKQWDLLSRAASTTTHWFWLDTFCIPVGTFSFSKPELPSAGSSITDQMAIDSMRHTYAAASPVLVLDSQVLSLPSEADLALKLAYITYCGWATRGWTLQEASLGKNLVFALSDGVFDPYQEMYEYERPRIHRTGFEMYGNPGYDPAKWPSQATAALKSYQLKTVLDPTRLLYESWSERKLDIAQKGPRRDWESEALRKAWNSLLRCHCSESKDLPVILATLLGLTASESFFSERRVETIIASLGRIPVSFLYSDESQSLPQRPVVALRENGPQLEVAQRLLNRISLLGAEAKRVIPLVNRWVPRSIKGSSLPPGPFFEVLESVLRLQKFDNEFNSGLGCNVFICHNTRTIPKCFILKTAQGPVSSFYVDTCCQEPENTPLKEIEDIAKGFCFIMEGSVDTLLQKGAMIRGAILAIVNEAPKQIRTVFHCAIRVRSLDSDLIDCAIPTDVKTVNAASIDLDVIDLVYDRNDLGPSLIGKLPSMYLGPFESVHAVLAKLNMLFYGADLVFTVILIIITPTFDVRPIVWLSIIHLVLMALYALIIYFLRPRYQRRHIFMHYGGSSAFRTRNRKLDTFHIVVDHLVRSQFVVFLAFALMLIIQVIASANYGKEGLIVITPHAGILVILSMLVFLVIISSRRTAKPRELVASN